MNLRRIVGAAVLAAGVGASSLFGLGITNAAADPGQQCGRPGTPNCQQGGPGPGPAPVEQRGIDQGRQDHQPFTYRGQKVTPMPAGNGAGWGFWFLGQWMPL